MSSVAASAVFPPLLRAADPVLASVMGLVSGFGSRATAELSGAPWSRVEEDRRKSSSRVTY